MKILAICGSLRHGSSNLGLLRAAVRLAPPTMEIEIYEGLGTLPHFNPDLDGEGSTPPAAVLDLRERVAAASGLIISTPEYAHGLPGSMKNALDWLVSSPAPIGKPVVLWNAAPYGGEYAQASLVETLQVMGLLLLLDASRVEPFLSRKLDGEGLLPDPESEAVLRASLAMLAAVIGDR